MVGRLNRGLVPPPSDENVALRNKEDHRPLAWSLAHRLIGIKSEAADLELVCGSRIGEAAGVVIPSEDGNWIHPVADNTEDGSQVLELGGQARSDDIVRVGHALDNVSAQVGVERSWGDVDALSCLKVNSVQEKHG